MSSADHFTAVYRDHVEAYQQLVEYEDAQGRLWRLLDQLVDWRGLRVVELGAGTGRLTVPLAARARHVDAVDQSAPMLEHARRRLAATGRANVALHVAEHRHVALPDRCADALIEGWSVAHYVDWEPDGWRSAVNDCLTEVCRLTVPGAPIVFIETLGTGVAEPAAPTQQLAELYEHLERQHGFERHWVRTDYAFPDASTASDVVARFFGDEMVERLDGVTLAECTGVWTRHRERDSE